jgi:ribosome-binding protein aMBF1 (putative translation factor)
MRKESGLSIVGLAKQIGYHRSMIHRWEAGERPIERKAEMAILAALLTRKLAETRPPSGHHGQR